MAQVRAPRPPRPVARPKRSTRTPPPAERPPLVVVGAGRMGGALALGLLRAGWPLSVFPRSGESLRRAVQLGLPIADHDLLGQAQLAILAVPDGAVAKVTASLLLDLGPSTALVHCAGALDLSAFGTTPALARRRRGSFHPLVAVSDPGDPLAGHAVALSATGRPLLALLRRMALDLELEPLEVPEAYRAAYHAGAVLAAGGVVSVLAAAVSAFRAAGIPPGPALRALLPLSFSALRGVEQRGLTQAVTGPVPRGDLAVVRAHLGALPGELALLYRQLSLVALELVGPQLPPETRSALVQLLR